MVQVVDIKQEMIALKNQREVVEITLHLWVEHLWSYTKW